MIRVEGLSRSFGAIRAIDDVGFEARDGRITGLLGPNGAGKSTTLRVLYTVLRPDAGTASVDGIDVIHDPLAARRVDELITELDIGDCADRRAKGFSQGQRIKVALARALVHQPRNLLLDEPSNGLDVMATRALRALILALRAAGHCVLFSSHVMQEVAALCDDIVIIDHGRVVAAGTPAELLAQFRAPTLEDAFVAAIGDARGLE